ncbi:MAG: DJ-1/PfpI family protein [Bacteroidota bacterium]
MITTRRSALKSLASTATLLSTGTAFSQTTSVTREMYNIASNIPQRIAYIVFDGITWLDFFGIYDPLSRLKSMGYLPDLSWDICAYTDTATDNFNLQVKPHKVRDSLADYDVIIVPGGFGTRELRYNEGFMNWMKTADRVPLKTSICTGSLLLGAAGFLKGKIATTNFSEYETLKPYCQQVATERIVEDNGIITAGAVSASLDLGLYLCEKWVGKEATTEIKTRMNYQG